MENKKSVGHLAALFTGLCGICLYYLLENIALRAVKASVYIYIVPVITVVTSVLILKEPVTWVSVMGTVLAVVGLFLSGYNGKGSDNSE